MTAVTSPRRRPAPPRRQQRPAPGPALRVVAPRAERRRRPLLAVGVTAVLAASVLGLVASHVVLTQGQFRLEQLRELTGAEQARYERLRLQVAALESPGRIVAAAQQRLGMVPPPSVTYLSPSGTVSPAAGGSGDRRDDLHPGDESWAEVKGALAGGP